ncbi:hypothetical protein OC842_001907 [Tilletia horrida]|uniref:Uncharacterized protein n=1 Tax=Tilletia horrida TaxID=155126 RepID=A0AAN6JSP6_9BASI|nr:hypothetical protein OC842_001907 [Tilletia horrida]
MHASSSRLITIRPLTQAAVASDGAGLRLPPALRRQVREAQAATAAQQAATDGSASAATAASAAAAKALRADTAGKLLLQRERAVQAAAARLPAAGNDADARQPTATTAAVAAQVSSWPSNLRIEPEANKRDLYWKVPSEQREALRKMLKDR